MTELEHEREQLVVANTHLLEGEQRIVQQHALMATLTDGSADLRRAADLLRTLEDTLVQWRVHRDAIIERIAVLEAEAAGGGPAP